MKGYIDSATRRSRRSSLPAPGGGPLIRAGLGFLVLLLVLVTPASVLGQDSPITVSVNRTDFSTDELIVLTARVTDESPQQPRPVLPPLDGLAVIDLDISTDVSVVGGKIRTEVTYTYRLQPRRTGLLVIPPVTVEIDGEIYRAAPITIRVRPGPPPAPSQGNAVPPVDIRPPAALAGQDFFVESQVDVAEPYVGQQIIYTFRFYQAIQLYRPPQYEGPLFTGFETQGMPVQEYHFEVDDRTYLITEIQTALFPKTAGRVTVDPARLTFPGNFFEEPVELSSEPIILNVQQLPGNAPPDFGGAIGHYSIRSWFSPQVAVINQPSSFYIAVSGAGNIQALPEPNWPGLGGWRTYDSLTSLTTDTDEGQVTGTRMYERLMVPDQVGEFTMPPATLVYFDPAAGEYKQISTEPVAVKVIPAPTPEPTTAAATAIAVAPTVTPASVAANVATPQAAQEPVNRPFSNSRFSEWNIPFPIFMVLLLGLCGLLPLAVVAGAGGVWLWQKRIVAAKEEKRQEAALQQPAQRIHPTLAAAMRKGDDNFLAVSRALQSYLEDILDAPVKGLTRPELVRRLEERGLSRVMAGRISDCLVQSEVGRYGPPTTDAGWPLVETVDELLHELDAVLGRSRDSL